MRDGTYDIEAWDGAYESYLEEQEERRTIARNEEILIRKIDRRIEIAKPGCICNQGIHDGKRVDCACKLKVEWMKRQGLNVTTKQLRKLANELDKQENDFYRNLKIKKTK